MVGPSRGIGSRAEGFRPISWISGAIIQDLRLKEHDAPLVLGFERVDDYLDHSLFFGAMVGRHANRIRNGHFALDGEHYQIDADEGRHALHGGSFGLHERLWEIVEVGPAHCTLSLKDPHREDGFPGDLDIICTYRLKPPATLCIEVEARTNRPTLCNLAHHSYFNLDDGGEGDILDHRIMIRSFGLSPGRRRAHPHRPCGARRGNRIRLRTLPRPIRLEWEAENDGLRSQFLPDFPAPGPLRQAAWLSGRGAARAWEMEVWTTEPGLQFFDGNFPRAKVPGARRPPSYGARSGAVPGALRSGRSFRPTTRIPASGAEAGRGLPPRSPSTASSFPLEPLRLVLDQPLTFPWLEGPLEGGNGVTSMLRWILGAAPVAAHRRVIRRVVDGLAHDDAAARRSRPGPWRRQRKPPSTHVQIAPTDRPGSFKARCTAGWRR